MSKPDQTPMNDLLSRRTVDERERSPDDQPSDSIAETSEPEAFDAREAFSDKGQTEQPQPKAEAGKQKPETQPKAKAEDADDEGEGDEKRRMNGLPKWAYLKLQANNERTEAAQREVAQLRNQLNSLTAQRNAAGQEGEEGDEETWDQWTKKQIKEVEDRFEQRDWQRRTSFSFRLALKEHGEEITNQAASWAKDKMEAHPGFRAAMFQSDDPYDFAVSEFRKAQFELEAQKFGFDIDKMLAARAAKQPSQARQQAQPDAGEQTGAASPTQNEPRMPSDFASTGTGAGRVNGDAGATPLGDLLNINTRRR